MFDLQRARARWIFTIVSLELIVVLLLVSYSFALVLWIVAGALLILLVSVIVFLRSCKSSSRHAAASRKHHSPHHTGKSSKSKKISHKSHRKVKVHKAHPLALKRPSKHTPNVGHKASLASSVVVAKQSAKHETSTARISSASAEVIHSSQTPLDKAYEMVQKKGSLKLDVIVKVFKIKKELAEEWASVLEKNGLVDIKYPALGSPLLVKKVMRSSP